MLFYLTALLALTSFSVSENVGIQESWVSELIRGNKPEILIAQFAAKAIQWRLQRNMEALSQKRPIISPIADPVVIPELINTPIDINFPEIISFVGHIKIEETEIRGLSELVDDFRMSMPIVVIPLTLNWTMGLPLATLSGPFTMDVDMDGPDLSEAVKFEGTGDAKGSVESVFFRMNAAGRAPAYGNMELQHLDVDLGFKNLSFALEGLNVGGQPNNMSNIATIIQSVFNLVWTEDTRPLVNEMIRCSLNHTIAKCNIQQLIQGYWGCLDLTLDPRCFGQEEPTTTTTELTTDMETEETTGPSTSTEGNNEPTTSTEGNSDPTTSTEGKSDPTTSTEGKSDPTTSTEGNSSEPTTSTDAPTTTPTGGGSSSFHISYNFCSMIFCMLTIYLCF